MTARKIIHTARSGSASLALVCATLAIPGMHLLGRLGLRVLLDVALGTEEESKKYVETLAETIPRKGKA